MLWKWGGDLWALVCLAVVVCTPCCNIMQTSVTQPWSSKRYWFCSIENKGIFVCFFSHCSRVAKDHDRSPEHVRNYCQCGNYPRVEDVRCSCWWLRSGAGSPGWPQRWLCESCGGDAGPQAWTSQRKGENWRPRGQVIVCAFRFRFDLSAIHVFLSQLGLSLLVLGDSEQVSQSHSLFIFLLSLCSVFVVVFFCWFLACWVVTWCSSVTLLCFLLVVYVINNTLISWWVLLWLSWLQF